MIQSSSGTALGTLVNVIHHDHTAFRVPHAPDVIALLETDKPAIELALSSRSADFAAALEFTVWYASHLESQGADTLESQGADTLKSQGADTLKSKGADTLKLNTAADLEPAQW